MRRALMYYYMYQPVSRAVGFASFAAVRYGNGSVWARTTQVLLKMMCYPKHMPAIRSVGFHDTWMLTKMVGGNIAYS